MDNRNRPDSELAPTADTEKKRGEAGESGSVQGVKRHMLNHLADQRRLDEDVARWKAGGRVGPRPRPAPF